MARKRVVKPKVCAVCGREFIVMRCGLPVGCDSVRYREAKICRDPACRSEAARESQRRAKARPANLPHKKPCVVCGKQFAPSRFRNGRKWWLSPSNKLWHETKACSRKCGRVIAGEKLSQVVRRRNIRMVHNPPGYLPTPEEIDTMRREIDRANGYAERPRQEDAA